MSASLRRTGYLRTELAGAIDFGNCDRTLVWRFVAWNPERTLTNPTVPEDVIDRVLGVGTAASGIGLNARCARLLVETRRLTRPQLARFIAFEHRHAVLRALVRSQPLTRADVLALAERPLGPLAAYVIASRPQAYGLTHDEDVMVRIFDQVRPHERLRALMRAPRGTYLDSISQWGNEYLRDYGRRPTMYGGSLSDVVQLLHARSDLAGPFIEAATTGQCPDLGPVLASSDLLHNTEDQLAIAGLGGLSPRFLTRATKSDLACVQDWVHHLHWDSDYRVAVERLVYNPFTTPAAVAVVSRAVELLDGRDFQLDPGWDKVLGRALAWRAANPRWIASGGEEIADDLEFQLVADWTRRFQCGNEGTGSLVGSQIARSSRYADSTLRADLERSAWWYTVARPAGPVRARRAGQDRRCTGGHDPGVPCARRGCATRITHEQLRAADVDAWGDLHWGARRSLRWPALGVLGVLAEYLGDDVGTYELFFTLHETWVGNLGTLLDTVRSLRGATSSRAALAARTA